MSRPHTTERTPDHSMSAPTKALIREVPLTYSEKMLLYTIDSHQGGEMYASAKTITQWMCSSLPTFYRARKTLLDSGLIEVDVRPGETSVYTIKKEGLQEYSRTVYE